MLRILFPFLLVLACCFGSVADDKAANTVNDILSELVPKAKKVERIGIQKSGGVSPAVHVNANGVEYGSGQANKTVNKLRSARDSILLPSKSVKAPAKQPVRSGNGSSDSFAGTSSRRAKPARISTQPTAEPIAAPVGIARKCWRLKAVRRVLSPQKSVQAIMYPKAICRRRFTVTRFGIARIGDRDLPRMPVDSGQPGEFQCRANGGPA